jgi:SlyX protein
MDALEARLMYQDETIEQLNQTITAQWKQIDSLTRPVAARRRESGGGYLRPFGKRFP